MTSGSQKVQFAAYNDGQRTQVEADHLEVTTPDGRTFLILSDPGRLGSALLHIDARPDDAQYSLFIIEPGAANTVAVRVEKVDKRKP